MRRLLSFRCAETWLAASLDAAEGEVGLLLVTGGSQTRVGSHRMSENLCRHLATQNISCFRFDRRGVGDSDGEDPGFLNSGPDIAAAAAAMRAECPALRRLFGFGLCDGATALALFGDEAGLDGLILVNPWLVEAASGEPPPAAIRRHYRDRLLSLEGWKRLLGGGVDYRKLFRGVLKSGRSAPSTLARQVAAALARHRLPVAWILASGDATAIAAEAEMKSSDFKGLSNDIQKLDTDSHTFARPGDEERLREAVIEALRQIGSPHPR